MKTFVTWRLFCAGLLFASSSSALEDRRDRGGTSTRTYDVVDIGTLGGDTDPFDVNFWGDVVGSSEVGSYPHAFLYRQGHMLDLGTLGGPQSNASGINDRGQVVGMAYVNSGAHHAFLFSDGQIKDLGVLPGGWNSSATGITNTGLITGLSDTTNEIHAFLYFDGKMKDLGTLGGNFSIVRAANLFGLAIGESSLPGETGVHPFLYSRGRMIDLGTLGGAYCQTGGINIFGQITGACQIAGQPLYHVFLYSRGVMKDIGTLGGLQSGAGEINDFGQMVGGADSPTGYHAFLYEHGVMMDLNNFVVLDTVLVNSTAINNRGQIVAHGANMHGYLLTPARRR